MGGFSVIGRVARGYWTRLWARAIYLEDHQGDALVLTICDLWSIPGGLSDRVAEIVARDEAGRHIGRAQIILAATHTHHSPGNFSTSTMYNGFASPRSGFDPRLFDFLAHRIARIPATVELCSHAPNDIEREPGHLAQSADQREALEMAWAVYGLVTRLRVARWEQSLPDVELDR